MPTNWQEMPVPFTAGIDTKTDAKAVAAPKLLTLENAVFTKGGTVKRRNGYTALGQQTLDGTTTPGATSVSGLSAYNDELVLFADNRLYSYSTADNGWLDRGALQSVVTTTKTIAREATNKQLADQATASGVTLYVWEDALTNSVKYAVMDEENGSLFSEPVDLGANTSRPRAMAINGFLHVIHYNSAAAELRTVRLSPQSLAADIGSTPITLCTDINASGLYDVANAGTYAVLAYNQTTNAIGRVIYVQQSGNVTLNTQITFASAMQCIAVTVEPTTLQVAVVAATNVPRIHGTILDASLNTVVALTTLFNPALPGTIPALTCAFLPSSQIAGQYTCHVFYSNTAAATYNYALGVAYLSTHGEVRTGAVLMRHVALASRAFVVGNQAFVNVVFDSTLQATYFLVRHDGVILGRTLPGIAGGIPAKTGILPQVDHSDSVYGWAGIYKTRLDSAPTGNGARRTNQNAVFTETGIKSIRYDVANEQAYRTVQAGQTLYVTGGQLWQYDGHSPVESSFLLYPENISGVPSVDGGSLTSSKSYSYRVYYEWTNDKGERERSTTAAVLSVTLGASDNTVTLTVPTLAQTLKSSTTQATTQKNYDPISAGTTSIATSPRSEVAIVVYRTEGNPTDDSPFYRVSNTNPTVTGSNGYLANDPLTDTVTFIDGLADASILTKELDYQNTGELDNLAPPPPGVIAIGPTRAFLSGFENPSEVWFSKIRSDGSALSWNDANVYQVIEQGGAIVALAILDDKVIVFKERAIFGFSGEGPDNLGQGLFSDPALISADVGCTDARSVIGIPDGLMFQSDKGIYYINRSLQVSYIGAEVESYNAQTVTAATLLADSNQVRILTRSGKTLLYDYFFNQWGTFTGHTGIGAAIVGGTYYYVTSSGEVRRETGSAGSDAGAPYYMVLETSWLKSADFQGYQRAREVLLLGNYKGAHTLNCQVGYDYETQYTGSTSWDPSTALNLETWGDDTTWGSGDVWGGTGSTVYQFRWGLPRQKCEALRFRFTDSFPGDATPGDSYELTGLSLRIGFKSGPDKLPATKTVGA